MVAYNSELFKMCKTEQLNLVYFGSGHSEIRVATSSSLPSRVSSFSPEPANCGDLGSCFMFLCDPGVDFGYVVVYCIVSNSRSITYCPFFGFA